MIGGKERWTSSCCVSDTTEEGDNADQLSFPGEQGSLSQCTADRSKGSLTS